MGKQPIQEEKIFTQVPQQEFWPIMLLQKLTNILRKNLLLILLLLFLQWISLFPGKSAHNNSIGKKDNNVANKTRDKKRKAEGRNRVWKRIGGHQRAKWLKSIKYSYLAVDAALCVILSCVRDATYDMPFPSAPRSKTCGNSVTINICPCPIKFGVFCSALNSHLTNEICQVHVLQLKNFSFFFVKSFNLR